jgi:uncharacterized Rmd1/YagE family protein
MSEPILLYHDTNQIQLRAFFLGTRIDVLEYEKSSFVSKNPLTLKIGEHGHAVVLKFGVVVLMQLDKNEEIKIIHDLSKFVHNGFRSPEWEEADVLIKPDAPERIDANGSILIREASSERLQIVSLILAKSSVLAHYEKQVTEVFTRIEKLAENLTLGHIPSKDKDLLREIGNVLSIQAWTVGRVEVTEKPELTWDNPELDRLYERLAYEYELRDRDLALNRKLELISNTAETFLELLHSRQSIRVEWYIVVLILIEVALIIYEIYLF